MAGTESRTRRAAPAVVGRATKTAGRSRQKTSARGALVPVPPRQRGARFGDRLHAVWSTGQLAALLGAICCGAAIAFFLGSSALAVRRLDLTGAALTTPQQIAAAGGVEGHNLFTVDPQGVAERLVALPTIRKAEVRGALPDRLIVQIVERQPIALWQVGDARYLIDASGFVMAVNPPEDVVRGLPQATVREGDAPQVGGRIAPEPVAALVTISQEAATYGVTIKEIDYTPASGLTIMTPGSAQSATPRQILIGSPTRLEEKLAASGEIIRTEQHWTILNVTDPERPFFPAR